MTGMPKEIYKFRPYIMGPRTGRVHLDEGDPPQAPWWQNYDPINGAPPDQPPPPIPRSAPPSPEPNEIGLSPEYNQAYSDVKAVLPGRPVLTEPHWWQKAIAGGLGGLAGWSNAASRTRHPIDIGAMTQAVEHPGYQERLQDWQSQVAALQGPMNLEAQRQNAALKAEQIAAQAEGRRGTAEWRKALADPHHGMQQIRPEDAPWIVPDKNGEVWVDKSTSTQFARPVKQPVDRGQQVTDPDIAATLGVKPGDFVDRDLYKTAITVMHQKPTNPTIASLYQAAASGDQEAARAVQMYQQDQIKKALQTRRPTVDQTVREQIRQRFQDTHDLRATESNKDTALRQLEAKTASRVDAAKGDQDTIDRIYAEHANEKQAIQNEYEQRVSQITGSAQPHFAYGGQRPKAAAPAPSGPPQIGMRIEESQETIPAIPTVRNKADFDRLPKGAVYLNVDGRKYRKP